MVMQIKIKMNKLNQPTLDTCLILPTSPLESFILVPILERYMDIITYNPLLSLSKSCKYQLQYTNIVWPLQKYNISN